MAAQGTSTQPVQANVVGRRLGWVEADRKRKEKKEACAGVATVHTMSQGEARNKSKVRDCRLPCLTRQQVARTGSQARRLGRVQSPRLLACTGWAEATLTARGRESVHLHRSLSIDPRSPGQVPQTDCQQAQPCLLGEFGGGSTHGRGPSRVVITTLTPRRKEAHQFGRSDGTKVSLEGSCGSPLTSVDSTDGFGRPGAVRVWKQSGCAWVAQATGQSLETQRAASLSPKPRHPSLGSPRGLG